MRLLIFLSVLVLAQGHSSPHGDEFLSKLSDERKKQIDPDILEDSLLDVVGLIKKYGYPVETHEVRTKDGYLLDVHRIPGGRISGKSNENRSPVFLMHGLLMSSTDWIINGPSKGLGYILADEGYDVWMGNARGTFYSRKHATLDPDKDASFWKFSWHEIGTTDLPAMIDYVLKETNRSQLHYVGHSQGTTSFFVMGARERSYNAKIKSMHALAPAAYMHNLQSPLFKFLAPTVNTVEALTSLIGVNEFYPNTEFMTIAAHLLCSDGSAMQEVCANSIFLLCGYNPDQLNYTMLPVYMSHTPAGAASRQMVHYGQSYLSRRFRLYDFGIWLNPYVYGTWWPPSYNLGHVTAPVFLHYSDNDWLVDPKDVDTLFKELGNPIGKFRVPMATFAHLDFVWGIDARTLIYNRVINLIAAFD